MQLYPQHRVRRPNIFGAGLWASSGAYITVERAGSDITPEHISDTSPALSPAVRPDGPHRPSPVSRLDRASCEGAFLNGGERRYFSIKETVRVDLIFEQERVEVNG